MLRTIDTERLAHLRVTLSHLERALSDHRAAARRLLGTHGRPDVTWRLTTVESWLAAAQPRLTNHIAAAQLTAWLEAPIGEGPAPRPVAAWDAIYSALGPVIAAHWLAGLSSGEQRLIGRWRASIVSTLPGAPQAARVEANRHLIEIEVDQLQSRIDEVANSLSEFPAGTNAHQWRLMLIDELQDKQEILRRLGQRHPIHFAPGEDGRFVEWIGPENADHVVVFVPGTGHSVWTADDLSTTGLHVQQTAAGLDEASVAVVVAMGYDAPNNIPAAAFSSYADHGGPELAAILDSMGLSNDRHVTLVGHSYGSYVATEAMSHLDHLRVDDLVLVGSPGVGVDSVTEIPIDPGHVWVGLTDNDSITLTSSDRWMTWVERIDLNPFDWTTWDVRRDGTYENLWFGTNPAHPSFGAQRVEMFHADGHSGYFGPGERSRPALENLGRVFVGLDPVLDE